MYKLFANRSCPYVQRVLIGKLVRRIKNTDLPIQWVDFADPPEELIAINNDWTVPTLSYAPNMGFDDSVQILEFLDGIEGQGPKLFGDNSVEIAATRFLIRQLQRLIIQPLKECMLHRHNPVKFSAPAEKLVLGYEFTDTRLPTTEFFMGNKLKAPDIVLAPFFKQLRAAHDLNAKIPMPSPLSRTGIYFESLIKNSYVNEACPEQEDLLQQIQQFYSINPKLAEVQQATIQILTSEAINKALLGFPKNSPWSLARDSVSSYLKATIASANPTETLRILSALHSMQETVNHHANISLNEFTQLNILLRTNKPTPGITAKDICFAKAFVEVVLSASKYGEEESSIFN